MNKRMTATLALLLFLACLATPALGRYLDPQTGRFRTMDSYEGSQGDPLSLHKYLYAQANPVNRIDPSGQSDGSVATLVTAIGIAANLAFTYADSVRLRDAQISGNSQQIAESSAYLTVDILLLAIPYSGLGGTFGRGGAVAIESYVQASAGITTQLRGAWAGIRTLVLFSK